MATLLEDYGLIGDSTTLALISRDGSLDWMCLPRVDSDACFARLLGTDDHGYWKIRPTEEVKTIRQRYLPETLVLETEMTCAGGKIRLVDFMPPGDAHHDVVRIVEGVEGEVTMHLDLKVRFAYGRLLPWIQLHDHQATLTAGPDALAFSSPVELTPDWDDARLEAEFTLRAGQRLPFTLAYYPSHELRQHVPIDAERELARTIQHWQSWTSHCRYEGPYRDAVIRSFITLKALTYQPTGGILAAATTSVPEELGGVRNWDYRFCWLRDATFTLDALMLGGYHEEAHAWRDWLLRATAGAPSQAQIMYGIAGRHRLTETTLPWLPGYEGSAPVRIGNAAYGQFQLDIYGEVLNSLYEARTHGIGKGIPTLWNLPRGGRRLRREELAAHRRRHLGDPQRQAPPLHALQAHGLGGHGPRREVRRAVRPRGAGAAAQAAQPLARHARRDPPRHPLARLQRAARRVHPVLRAGRARRERAARFR